MKGIFIGGTNGFSGNSKIVEENFYKEPVDGKKRNIVLGYDEEGGFNEDIDELRLDNTKVLKRTEA